MTWSTPRTWVASELVSAATFNTELSDNLKDLYARTAWTAGIILPFGGGTPPLGWLECNGAAVSRTLYTALFTVVGTSFGVGDGSTTFNVPDTRSRAPIGAGAGSGLTARTLATSGGAETVVATIANLPSHNHGISDPTHTHQTTYRTNFGGGGTSVATTTAGGGIVTANATLGIGTQTGFNGSNGAHANMQPWAVALWIIKT